MKQLILVILSVAICWFGQTDFAFAATKVVNQESALTAYMEALKAGNLSRAAEIDCWGHTPTKMLGVESWNLKNATNDTWQVAIDFADNSAESGKSEWNFEVVSTLGYRTKMAKILDGSLNVWLKRANKLAKAVGMDLKEPSALKPEDLISVSKEPFCVASHTKID